MARKVSASALKRQIAREGGRLHLHPLVEDGRCHVAQEQRVWSGGGGGIGHIRRTMVPVCSIDMDHPLRDVARFRRRRWEHDRMQMYRATAERRRQAFMASLEARHHTLMGDAKRMVRVLGPEALRQATAEVFNVRPHAR